MLLRGLWPALAGIMLLAALVLPAGVVDEPWGRRCHLDWCRPSPSPTVSDSVSQALDGLGRVGAGCLVISRWPAGRIPAAVVVRDVATGQLRRLPLDQAVAAAQAGRVWSLMFCD